MSFRVGQEALPLFKNKYTGNAKIFKIRPTFISRRMHQQAEDYEKCILSVMKTNLVKTSKSISHLLPGGEN